MEKINLQQMLGMRIDACGASRDGGRRLSVYEESVKRDLRTLAKPGATVSAYRGHDYVATLHLATNVFEIQKMDRREIEVIFRNQVVRVIASRTDDGDYHVHKVLGDEYLRPLESMIEFCCQKEIAEAWNAVGVAA